MTSLLGHQRITFNIGGTIYETYESTLKRFPKTLLGDQRKRTSYFCSQSNEYFFDRHRDCFEGILYFYQSAGDLRCPAHVKLWIFEQECRYFLLPEKAIDEMMKGEGIIMVEDQHTTHDDDGVDEQGSLQLKLWNMLENPDSSSLARIVGIFSCLMVLLSIVTSAIETLPFYRVRHHTSHKYKSANTNTKDTLLPQGSLHIVEMALNVWFFIELLLRFLTAEKKFIFLTVFMNWIDFVSVVPYFVILFVRSIKAEQLLGVLKTLKFLRVIRLLRLSKHSRRLKVVVYILKSNLGNFKSLLLCLFIIVLIGGSLIYQVEQDSLPPHPEMTSIPQCLWWGVQTITSVGYGDIVPQTICGRVFSGCFMVFGALTMSLPVLTIVSQFASIYPKNVECEQCMNEEHDDDTR